MVKDSTILNAPLTMPLIAFINAIFHWGTIVRYNPTIKIREPEIEREPATDDECVQQLALLLELRDNRNLRELANLISRLAINIE